MRPEPALRIDGLTKAFRGKRAVDGVSLTVARGEIVGFLGPNGAGKTTVMNLVMGLVTPDGGQIDLLGQRDGARHKAVRLRIGYLQEKPRIYPEMTARAYLDFFARLYGVPDPERRVAAVLDRVGLAQAASRTLGTFSRGMQQRACLARVLLHEPEFLILDEPTLGLDPSGIAEMRDIFREMRNAGATLLFSSHQLAEMERICDSVIFMQEGGVIASGRPADLLPSADGAAELSVETFEPVAPRLDGIRALPLVARVRETGQNHIGVTLVPGAADDCRAARALLAQALAGVGLTVLSVGSATRSLEDLFLLLAEGRPAAATPPTKET
jgi:ABC-type multidrug transport system ATPase subunit